MYDVWKKIGNQKDININGNGSRKINVAIYCRVSTNHEEQLKALDNQISWFNDILPHYPNWKLVDSFHTARSGRKKDKAHILEDKAGYYIDEAASGLRTKNRPALIKLIDDCKAGKIDLILTREVCRFSRNIVDTLEISRELKSRAYGVGIYFYNDNIFTYENDAEMRLGIFATIAQNESQKVSERVRAGQKTSRSNNTLYGNGNILGYDIVVEDGPNHYEINEDQASTVKRIFELCLSGLGIMKISKVLIDEGRLNSQGQCKWGYHNIQRILKNKTYCGYVSYNCTVSDECLDFKRHNVNYSEREFHKVDASIVPPIISEELFEQCQKALDKRKIFREATTESNGRKKASKDVFAKKMACVCGSGFKRFKWNTTADGKTRYGYTCYNIINHHPESYYVENNIDITGLNLCNMQSFSDLKLRIQAKLIFDNLINFDELFSDVLENIKKENSSNKSSFEEEINLLNAQKIAEQERQDSLTEKYIDGKINEDIYQRMIDASNQKISKIESDIFKKQSEKQNHKTPELDIKHISETLKKVLDTSIDVNDELIDRFVFQIIVKSPTEFEWRLHFKEINSLTPNFVELMSLTADVEFAQKYSKDNHRLFKKSLWEPIAIKVMVAV